VSDIFSRRRILAIVGAGCACCAVLLVYSSASSGAIESQSTAAVHNVIATDTHARVFSQGASLRAGSEVIVTAYGFRANAVVDVRLLGGSSLSPSPHAGHTGSLRLVYRIPPTLSPGPHLLVLSGDASARPGQRTRGNDTATMIEANIPNVGLFEFEVSNHPPSRHS